MRIQVAISRAKRLCQSFAGIRGIDYGFIYEKGIRTRRRGLRFHFERKRPVSEIPIEQIIPRNLHGVACDVLEASYAPHDGLTPRGRVDPIQPGVSIGNLKSRTTGTLGALVRDKVSGDLCLLSNWHVLAAARDPRRGAPIGQPGPNHFGMETPPVVAELTRWSDPSHGIDAAIAKLKSDIQAIPTYFGLGFVPTDVKEPVLGMHVVKFGAVSEMTHAMVDGVEGSFVMDYTRFGDAVRWMDGLRLVPTSDHQEDEISLAGDSGSMWVTRDEHNPVGLHVGGEDGLGSLAEYGLMHSVQRVFRLMDVELHTGEAS